MLPGVAWQAHHIRAERTTAPSRGAQQRRPAEAPSRASVEAGVELLRQNRAVVSRCSFTVARMSLFKMFGTDFKYMLKIICS